MSFSTVEIKPIITTNAPRFGLKHCTYIKFWNYIFMQDDIMHPYFLQELYWHLLDPPSITDPYRLNNLFWFNNTLPPNEIWGILYTYRAIRETPANLSPIALIARKETCTYCSSSPYWNSRSTAWKTEAFYWGVKTGTSSRVMAVTYRSCRWYVCRSWPTIKSADFTLTLDPGSAVSGRWLFSCLLLQSSYDIVDVLKVMGFS